MTDQKASSRLFIGIPLNDEIKTILDGWAHALKISEKLTPLTKHIRWVLKENYHITVEFLGQISLEKFSLIENGLQEILAEIKPFELTLGDLLFLPSRKHPHVIAAKVGLTEELGRLRARVHQKMLSLEITLDERPWLPHVTLARIKNQKFDIDSLSFPQKNIVCSCEQIAIFESQNLNNVTIHHIISTCLI